jgi:release factor glutamine methyltransferase
VKAGKLMKQGEKTLKASPAIDHWQKDREEIESEDLLMHAMGVDEIDPGDDVPAGARKRYERLIARRVTGEPVQFIKGFAEFRGLELISKPGVFIPRDSTEFLAEQAVRRLRRRKQAVALDLATGGGTVALAVKNETKGVKVYGTDLSKDAVKIARKNAERLKLRAVFVAGDLFGGLPTSIAGRVDVITLHPPYVAKHELKELPDEIRNFEPADTLTDHSDDGLGLVERAAAGSLDWLRKGGWLLVEVSPDRAKAVAKVFRRNGYRDVKITKGGELKVTRVIVGRR